MEDGKTVDYRYAGNIIKALHVEEDLEEWKESGEVRVIFNNNKDNKNDEIFICKPDADQKTATWNRSFESNIPITNNLIFFCINVN